MEAKDFIKEIIGEVARKTEDALFYQLDKMQSKGPVDFSKLSKRTVQLGKGFIDRYYHEDDLILVTSVIINGTKVSIQVHMP
jgi:hypothetical protein